MLPSRSFVAKFIRGHRPGQSSRNPSLRKSFVTCIRSRCMSPALIHPRDSPGAAPVSIKRRKLSTTKFLTMPANARSAPYELTDVEENLRTLLLDVAHYIDNTPGAASDGQVALPDELAHERITLRFTGGWVRDKLLGIESHDIDVAINKMTGYQFGLRLKEYLEIPGNPEKYGLEGLAQNESQSNKAAAGKSKVVGGLHKIEANPEKSKHLETVTTKILGLDIDLVNLRKETYTEDSRNPQMEFGTPEEDALRRDATVNAMFYNLNTREIEDFTGKGHDDMANKIIRTPLEPFQTFKDDPLRVLRLIRFASRLGYLIDSEAEQWMKDTQIKDALQAKISRERVGVELEKMLRGPDPHRAVSLIDELTLYSTIFSDPTQNPSEAYLPDTANWTVVINFVQTILKSKDGDILLRDAEEGYIVWLLAAVVPYRDAPQPPTPEGKKAPPPVATTIAREGIKATNKVCDVITASIRNQHEITTMVQNFNEKKRRPNRQIEGEDPSAPEVIGMAIRRWGPSWRSQAAFALLVSVADEPFAQRVHLAGFSQFLEHVQDLNLLEAYAMKPILDGKSLSKALNIPTGPWMKGALDTVMKWQLRNPGKTDASEAIEEVKNANSHGELTASLMSHFLRLTIRPLFAKTQHPAVTAQGRKVTTTVLPKKFERQESEEVVKPWKGRDAYALDLLRWVINNLDDSLIEENWPWIVPPLLSITDDIDTPFKCTGCQLLKSLLDKTPPALLARTGLGEVFEEALMPCLGYLPSLTPEKESIELLSAAIPALVSLSRSMDIKAPPKGRTDLAQTVPRRIKLLDDIIRKGILSAYTHCPEHIRIVEVLLHGLCVVNNELGIESVKHLKYVLPVLSEVLGNPFGQAYPAALLAGTKALQSVTLNGWPRMAYNRGEVLKGLTLCWIHIHDEGSEGLDEVRKELKTTVLMLKDAVGSECDIKTDFKVLIEADDRLGGLLAVD